MASEASEVLEKVPPCNQVEARSASRLPFSRSSGDSRRVGWRVKLSQAFEVTKCRPDTFPLGTE